MPFSEENASTCVPDVASLRRPALRYFGDYVLLGEIARGGMGVVYRGLQTSLDREVAIKMIDAGALASADAVRRFHIEAEAMAKLDHPNIVSIHEIGEYEGHHYFAMKLVDGPSLAERMEGQVLDPRFGVELLLKVARAVQYAHERGVLHRDLKPSNILLDERDEPHVTDFGIAKLVQREAGVTRSISTMGTPQYMAPEQAVGKTREVGTAADIYSLGAVLHHLLTGVAPFGGDTPFEILERVVKEPALPPSHRNPAIDPQLDAICLRALEKKPERRQSSAGELAQDLERWLATGGQGDGDVVASRRQARSVRAPVLVGVGAVALAGLALAILNPRLKSRITREETRPDKQAAQTAPLVSASNVTVPVPVSPIVVTTTNTAYVTKSPSGIVREHRENTASGERIRFFSPTGRLQKEELRRTDGALQTTEFDLGNRAKRISVLHPDRKVETTDILYDSSGDVRWRETTVSNVRGGPISRTVTVRQSVVGGLQAMSNAPSLSRSYLPGRWSFVYRPVSLPASAFGLWHDPFWAGPTPHSFTYPWGWTQEPWYQWHAGYWEPSATCAGPLDWVTDWLLAGYLSDRFASIATIASIEAEVHWAGDEVLKARQVVTRTRDSSERTEAKDEQARFEARMAKAEVRLAKTKQAEQRRMERTGQPRPGMMPIQPTIKGQLKQQIERYIGERESVPAGKEPLLPTDVTRALKESNYIYPVSKTISVTLAADNRPAGTLTVGDLLVVEPGQESALKDPDEHTTLNMRVIASKGEEESVPGGTVVAVPIKELQEFDNDLRARLDAGLIEAERRKDEFRKLPR